MSAWTPPPVGFPCWIEIPAVDVKACKEFYSSLFPSWKFKPGTEAYPEEKIAMWSFPGDSGLGGGITQACPDNKDGEQKAGTGMTLYFLVESIEETKKKAESLGATATSEKTPEGDHGWYMLFKDVSGNRFAIYEFKSS